MPIEKVWRVLKEAEKMCSEMGFNEELFTIQALLKTFLRMYYTGIMV